jgi:hypothetical protein
MTDDARFEDASSRALRLKAEDADDLGVISALIQDAVFPASEIKWQPSKRRFAMLINRFRWEDQSKSPQRKRAYERVQSVLAFDDISKVSSQGVERGDPDMVLSLLSLTWEPGEDGTGKLLLTLAGDGSIALEAECINVTLQDVTQNYIAPSGKAPSHPA